MNENTNAQEAFPNLDVAHLHRYLSMMSAACPQGEVQVTLNATQLQFLVSAVAIAGEL